MWLYDVMFCDDRSWLHQKCFLFSSRVHTILFFFLRFPSLSSWQVLSYKVHLVEHHLLLEHHSSSKFVYPCWLLKSELSTDRKYQGSRYHTLITDLSIPLMYFLKVCMHADNCYPGSYHSMIYFYIIIIKRTLYKLTSFGVYPKRPIYHMLCMQRIMQS